MYKSIILGFEFEVDNIYSAFDEFINNTKAITGINYSYVSGYHQNSYRTTEGVWRLEEDESVENGVEFISPPMNYYDARKMCKDFFQAIEDTPHIETTYDCGLHVGMSVSGNLDSVNMKNIIPSLNYQLLGKLWPDRMLQKHSYCRNIQSHINKMNIHWESGSKSLKIDNISNELLTLQNSFIRLKTFNENKYLEIRIPGGENYHRKFKELFITIDHIADVLLGKVTTTKKKIQQKMMSYINRANIRSKTGLYSIKKFDPTATQNIKYIDSIFRDIEGRLSHRVMYNTNNLNNYYYLYNVIKCLVINTKNDIRLYNLSKLAVGLMKISIPPNESQVDILKILKSKKSLPSSFVEDLKARLTNRAHKHFIKYQGKGA